MSVNSGFWSAVSVLVSLASLGVWICLETLKTIGGSFMEYRWDLFLILLMISIAVTGVFVACYKLWIEESWQERKFQKLKKLYNDNK